MSQKVCACGHTEASHSEDAQAETRLIATNKPTAGCRFFMPDRLSRGKGGIYCPCEKFDERVAEAKTVKTPRVKAPPTAFCDRCRKPLGPRSVRSTSTTHRACRGAVVAV